MQRRAGLIAAIGLLLWSPAVLAVNSSNYRVPSDVQGAGGGDEARSQNYRLVDTIGEPNVGPSASANYALQAGYRQTNMAFISISGPATITLPDIVGTGQATASGAYTVITDADGGYSLTWQASAVSMTSGGDTIAAFTPASANVPDTWSVAAADSEWGARLRSVSTDTAAEWGTDGVSDKWLNVATSSRTIVTRSSRTALAGSTEIVQFRAEVGTAKLQPTGAYSVTVTLTAAAL